MRILAIRGRNLASLARAFELDLARGPLAGAGLFAIAGPVGAGKTTLLDALCLALFDRTPRLSGRGGQAIGDEGQDEREWLRGNDPRALLRRDAAEGFAEADFVGRDGVRYRARWSVRRARRRPDGRVLDQEMSLRDLDGDVVVAGGRRTEVLAAIQARLGLDFAQFCRSVLLAQGDFAAFLKASADERARLLENLTGAEIYRRLSKAAHERCRQMRERLELLESQIEGQAVLSAGERAAIEGESARLDALRTWHDRAVRVAAGYVDWYRTASQRRQQESEAEVELQRAVAAQRDAAGRREALAVLARAAALVGQWRELAALARRQAAARDATSRQRAAVAAAEEHAAAARRALHDALGDLFGTTDAVPPIVGEFERWEPVVAQWSQARGAHDRLLAGLPSRRRAADAAATDRVRAAAAAKAAAAEVRRCETAVAAARDAAAAPEFVELPARRRRLAELHAEQSTLRDAWRVWHAAARDLAERQARARDCRGERERLAAGFAQLVAAREEAERELAAARRREVQARAHAGLSALRAGLVAGEPCPLCGAREHRPEHGAHDGDVLAAERAAAAAEARHRAAQAAVSDREGERRQAERAFARAEAELEPGAKALAAATAGWRAAAGGAEDLVLADSPGAAAAALDRRDAELDAQARAIAALDEAAARAAAAREAAGEALRRAHECWNAAQDAERAAVETETAGLAQWTRAEAELAAAAGELRARGDALQVGFAGAGDWRSAMDELGAGLVPRLRGAARLEVARREAEAAASAAQRSLERAVADEAQAESAAAEARARFAAAAAEARVAETSVDAAARAGGAAIEQEARALRDLDDAVIRLRTVVQERARLRQEHESIGRPEIEEHEAPEALALARRALHEIDGKRDEVRARLAADDLVRRQRDELLPRAAELRSDLSVWQTLDELIGSSNGDAFVRFAQGLTLDLLLVEANRRLAELARRYRLVRSQGGDMDFVVVDLDLGGTRRGLQTLSGGETFLVSLALALALATLAAPRSRVETLFLDEGFGTLDAQSLETALAALDTLQAAGCQVGVISHVEGIAERIGTVVDVQPEGGGQSRVRVRA